jgi:hypothetical protein
MRRRATAATLAATSLLCILSASLPPGATAAPAPAWNLTVTPMPANFAPDSNAEYMLVATNVGGAVTTSEPTVLEATPPAGLTVVKASSTNSEPTGAGNLPCPVSSQQAMCETTVLLHPGRWFFARIEVEVSGPEGIREIEASVHGGGADKVTTSFPTQVKADPIPFGLLPGFKAPLSGEDGSATTLAGSHPHQQTVDFGFPTENPGEGLTNDGHPRNFRVELPRGLVGSPAATSVLCTEAELTSAAGCPDASQVGVTDTTTLLGGTGNDAIASTALYNMVPAPGSPAEFATNVASVGIFVHIGTSVRSDDDYGVEASTRDVLAFGQQPIFNLQAQFWGDPSGKAHDEIRGVCREVGGSCQVPEQTTALLTMPGDCNGEPLPFEVFADSWEEPFPQFDEKQAFYESADLSGKETSAVQHCGELDFEPSIQVQPTTSVADSPSGLDFNLHQPQDDDLESLAPAGLRDAVIRFPAGLAVNPSQAKGLAACSQEEIGFEGKEGGTLFFSKQAQTCPTAAKIGTLEATSPALVRRNAAHELEADPEGHPFLEPVHGSLYLAKPFANPFEALVAVYLMIEDGKTGIVAKLAAKGELDPQTGQITTYVRESPELPLEDIHVHLFGGNLGALVTPSTCGTYATEADLTPWSAPEGKVAFPGSSFQTTATPLGGPCPTDQAQLPSVPKLGARTENPTAGAYSPLLFKVSREDGTQRLSKIEATMPAGLSARIAGVAQCSEAGIAKARSRESPQMGVLEQADPSCPAASEIGTVIAGAGAGPTPYYTQGHAYLAGPYRGAPLSVVAIAPAVAGPVDLGTVVGRIALYVDPITAQVRAVSDPLPTILDGVPIDLRSVALRAGRPNFMLNPTSCSEKAFSGQATSTLGSIAPLSERFQVGGCASLAYKPKLSARLFGPIHRGGHPRFRAVFKAKPGEANTARVSFTLPRSEFIDQGHFRTICTRVQFAANQCPAGSVYGFVKARTSLLDYTLEGPIYLRSSSHKLPDAVAALRGPASQPIEIDAAARIDSVKGRLRSTVETVPDAPLEEVVISLQGGKKGLFQNSTNLCKGVHRMNIAFDGQNGKAHDIQPLLKAQCKGKSKSTKQPKRGGRD